MAYSLILLSSIHTEPLDNGSDFTGLARKAEQMFTTWIDMPGFVGFAVVENSTGEVVHLVQ